MKIGRRLRNDRPIKSIRFKSMASRPAKAVTRDLNPNFCRQRSVHAFSEKQVGSLYKYFFVLFRSNKHNIIIIVSAEAPLVCDNNILAFLSSSSSTTTDNNNGE
jgi:hypothetical protein